MSSAAATSLISTPDRLLSFTAVALNRSPYLATLRGPALATTHLQAVSPRCQLIRGKLGVRVDAAVRPQLWVFEPKLECHELIILERVSPIVDRHVVMAQEI